MSDSAGADRASASALPLVGPRRRPSEDEPGRKLVSVLELAWARAQRTCRVEGSPTTSRHPKKQRADNDGIGQQGAEALRPTMTQIAALGGASLNDRLMGANAEQVASEKVVVRARGRHQQLLGNHAPPHNRECDPSGDRTAMPRGGHHSDPRRPEARDRGRHPGAAHPRAPRDARSTPQAIIVAPRLIQRGSGEVPVAR